MSVLVLVLIVALTTVTLLVVGVLLLIAWADRYTRRPYRSDRPTPASPRPADDL